MFKDVSSLNNAFGNLQGNPQMPDWNKLENQAKNIFDEYEELMEAIAAKDFTEVRDAICDILVFTLGLAHMAGAPVESDMAEVDASNRSKFCSTQEELLATVAKYSKLGVVTYSDGELPMARVKSSVEQIGNDDKVYRANKMLKSINFAEPVFAPV